MALDKVLKIYDEQGNPVDYDILASDVKFEPDGKDLPTKLNEMQDAIDEAASQGGIQQETDPTVPAWAKRSTPPTPQEIGAVPAQGYVPLTQSERDKLDNLPTADQLTQQLGNKANSNEVIKSISVNGQTPQTPQNGNVNIEVQAGEQVSVIQPDPADGTFIIRVGSTDYTINLNHTHENMAKLVVCEESDLPSTLDPATIYGVNDDGEIAILYVGGIPFYGGGGGTSSGPVLRRPQDESTIEMGDIVNGSVSYPVNFKGKGLTQDITVELTGTGFTFANNQPSGVTVVSSTEVTVDYVAVNSAHGVDVEVVYTGTDAGVGALTITSGAPDNISREVTLLSLSAVAYWNCEDAPVNNAWVDRENSLPLTLYGSAAKAADGYQLNNLSAPANAYARLDASANTLLNQKIDKVFTCIVDCYVKFGSADKKCLAIDFGGFTASSSNASIFAKIEQGGNVSASFKNNGNNSTGFSDSVLSSPSGLAFTIDGYTHITVKVGARLLQSGKQELYVECGNGKCYAVLDTPVKINFMGAATTGYGGAFALGVGYLISHPSDVPQYAADYLNDTIYKSIKIYNIEL